MPNRPQPFLDSLQFALKWEGSKFTNDPNDLGGATRFGVTQATYNGYLLKKNKQTKSVEFIEQDEVQDIYYEFFWLKAGCPNIVSAKVAMAIFDFVVNSGFVRKGGYGGMQIIQKAFGATADGIAGTATIGAINTVINAHNELFACKLIQDARRKNYERLGSVPSQKKWLKGWLNRVNDLSKELGV